MSNEDRLGPAPFERVAKAFIASRATAGTRELYTGDLRRWLEYCQKINGNVEDPQLEDAAGFRDLLEKILAAQTIRRILSALSKMYKVAVARKAAVWNPFDSDALPRPPADEVVLTKSYSREEAEALLGEAARLGTSFVEDSEKGLRDYTIMRFLYDTGMRISSVVSLKKDQIYKRADGKLVLVTKVKKKGRVEVEIPDSCAKAYEAWLSSYEKDSPFVFPSVRGKNHLTRIALNKRLEIYGKQVGIKGAAPHRFRASFATEAIDAGISLSEVQAAMHHSSPATTQRYDRRIRGTGVTSALAKFREEKK